jgi:hypothetical protein
MPRPVQFTRSARKHKIGRAHALAVIAGTEPTELPADDERDDRLVWVGLDDRGLELEVIAAIKPDCMLVFHVRPTSYLHQEP